MSNFSIPKKIEAIDEALSMMQEIFSEYKQGNIDKKEASKISKTVQSKLKDYKYSSNEKEKYDFVLDLCISMTTIKRAEGSFEKYFVDSLEEELEKAKNL